MVKVNWSKQWVQITFMMQGRYMKTELLAGGDIREK